MTSFHLTLFIHINLNSAILKFPFSEQLQCANIKLVFEKTDNFTKANPAAKDEYMRINENSKCQSKSK